MDMLIGVHALSLGLTLVASNGKEFRNMKYLEVADWTVEFLLDRAGDVGSQ